MPVRKERGMERREISMWSSWMELIYILLLYYLKEAFI